MSYSFQSRIRFSEIGADGKLTLNSIINYFQDCSNFHSEELQIGFGTLQEQQRAWMLSSWQIVVKRRPVMGEAVKIITWPYDFKGFYGYRNFVLESADGEVLAYANSIWVFLDSKTGVPAKVDIKEVSIYGIEEKLAMDYLPRKIAVPGEGVDQEAFCIRRSQLDIYQHVNNGQYVQMAQEYLPADYEIHQMRAEYKHQATLGSKVIPQVHQQQGIYTVSLLNEEREPFAVVEFR